ncbi:hypothetical protein HanIR_Chr13g0631921 [Helianthus annuus]|nr:hypothetical protein HanIR_Chr13g0631921 [Helianthus annuus]
MEHLVYIVGVNGVNEIRRTVALLNIILCGMNISMFRGSKKAKTSGQGSSSGAGSGSGVYQRRWEQLSNVVEGDGQLERKDWNWKEAKNSGSASAWKEEKTKALSRYNNKRLEAKMWKMKMVTGISKPVPDRAVCERTVDVEEFRKIGIVQRFEKLGWEWVID